MARGDRPITGTKTPKAPTPIDPPPADRDGRALRRALEGMAAATGAPIGWMLIQLARGISPLQDFARDPILYAYLFLGTMTVFALFGHYVGRQESRMRQQSWRDPLTGLYNLRYFNRRLEEQMATARREHEPVSIVYFDIDRFKQVNDAYGHAAGDAVLVGLGHHIGHILRQNELFARIGGEEFAVMVPIGGIGQAEQAAERILAAIRALEVPLPGGKVVIVTLSVGVVEQRPDDTLSTLMGRADDAMYAAKEQGRNRLVVDRNES